MLDKEVKLLLRAINMALEKPAPNRIPLSVPRALENDFCSVTLQDSDGNARILLRRRNDDAYEALVWRNEQEGTAEILTKEDIEASKLELRIERYYQGYQFSFNDPKLFILCEFFQWHKLVKIRDQIGQTIYNKRRLVREERIELLQHLVERKIENPRDEVHPLMLAVQRHSRKWLYHPDKDRHKAHLELVLDSFLVSGELIKNGSSYGVTGKALVTLAEYELSVQRHKDQISTAKVGNRLTWAIVIIGVAGIVSQVWMWAIERGST